MIDPSPPFVIHNAITCLVAYVLTHYFRRRWLIVGLALAAAFAASIFWSMASSNLEMTWRDCVWETALKIVLRPWDIDGESMIGILFSVLVPGTAAYFVTFALAAKDRELPKLTIGKLCGVVAGFALVACYLSRFISG